MSEINQLTVNGKVYDLADAQARGQMDMLSQDVYTVCSRNCLPMDYYDGDYKENNGITYRKQPEGTVTATGTATGASRYYIARGLPIQPGTYTLSGFPGGDNTKRYLVGRIGDSGSSTYFGSGSRTFHVTEESTLYVWIQYEVGSAPVEDQQWGVMLARGSEEKPFVSPNTPVGQMQKQLSDHAGQLSAMDCLADALGMLTPGMVDLKTMTEENPHTYIHPTTGALVSVVSALGTSNPYVCMPGVVLQYTLSADTGLPILVTYDKTMKMVNKVIGQGQNKPVTGEYVFSENERFFRITDCVTYLANHFLQYGEEQDPESPIPEYWQAHIGQKIEVINDKDCLIGGHGDSFIFITDTHLERNSMNAPVLMKEIADNTAVGFVINGGDTLDDDPTQAQALARFREWRKQMQGIREYRIMGNHDLNGSGQSVDDAKLTEDHWYGTMVKPLEHLVNTEGKPYYCIDNHSQKIRYICLSYRYNETQQRQWLKSRLTELEAGWSVLVIPHYLYGETPGVLHQHGQYLVNDINAVYDTMKATLIGILAGHTHADYSATEPEKGYLLIATTCDARDGTPAKTKGTATEQAFDVIHIDTANRKIYATRIGAGADRQWSY